MNEPDIKEVTRIVIDLEREDAPVSKYMAEHVPTAFLITWTHEAIKRYLEDNDEISSAFER